MTEKVKISLIIPTYNRTVEFSRLLDSIAAQVCDKALFEVIVVDQNDKFDLSPIIEPFCSTIKVIHERVSEKGLSKAKNRGISLSKGDFITFLDDDCAYYPDTVSSALSVLSESDADVVYGRIFDRETGQNIMRPWKRKPLNLNRLNFHLNYSAITCFSKRKGLQFDETFGIGAKYDMGEELDYIMRALNEGMTVIYHPDIMVWHPELNVNVMTDKKVFGYAEGYGATFRKNLNIYFGLIFFSSIAFLLVDSLRALVTNNKPRLTKRKLGLKGRISGFINYSDR